MAEHIQGRLVVRRLRNAVQVGHLGKQFGERAAFVQHLKKDLRGAFHQGAAGLFPDPLGGQVRHLPAHHDVAHQFQGGVRHPETHPVVAGGEARHAQHAQRVLGEGRRHMAQNTRL